MNSSTHPVRLNLKRNEQLEIAWSDGRTCVYPIVYLRQKCPCAQCREERDEKKRHPRRLTVLTGGSSATPLSATDAELVGNYGLKIHWSDGHDAGIYTFDYLREICPKS